jgi:hypothetical protein
MNGTEERDQASIACRAAIIKGDLGTTNRIVPRPRLPISWRHSGASKEIERGPKFLFAPWSKGALPYLGKQPENHVILHLRTRTPKFHNTDSVYQPNIFRAQYLLSLRQNDLQGKLDISCWTVLGSFEGGL